MSCHVIFVVEVYEKGGLVLKYVERKHLFNFSVSGLLEDYNELACFQS